VPSVPHLKTKTDPVSEELCFKKYYKTDKVQKLNNPNWLRLTLSTGPSRVGAPYPTPEDGNIQFPRRCDLKNSGRWKKSKNSIIHIAMHHRQNAIESNRSLVTCIFHWSCFHLLQMYTYYCKHNRTTGITLQRVIYIRIHTHTNILFYFIIHSPYRK